MQFIIIFTIFLGAFCLQANAAPNNSFDAYYSYLWGGDHFSINSERTEVQLKFDNFSGAGFNSKSNYGSGLFHVKMKIPTNKSGGIVPNFYLMGLPVGGDASKPHFEIDFEFMGSTGRLQTNVYNNDTGGREQRFQLWFDPSADYHTYEILWNPSNIQFLVDDIPIRVFKNNIPGVTYPNVPMHVEASIWNAQFAGSVDWSKSPFFTYYTDFGFYGCPIQGDDIAACASDNYFWNKYKELNTAQKEKMALYRKKYMTYDYCAQPAKTKTECAYNNV
ncbi:hypothetical protein ABFX02_01G103200 [Erythranthe guttata]